MLIGTRSSQWLGTAKRTTRGQGDLAVGGSFHRRRRCLKVWSLASIPDDVLVLDLSTIIGLPLAPRSAEETLLGLTAATHAGRIVGVVYATKIAADLTATTWDTCLVDPLMLSRLSLLQR